ncbi:hypothetical protein [Bordetella sp. 02P26C-1]|uniref:hypothetical protein n=1 Tax=Bordetella sp. 02P26C-1 TaxID=2683195 RepID=UPI001353C873|nr:hypothetical protein [Bordetella sp. 02P26C-1]MVW78082.1 hypothetical protein [Bordetella sp. 02P26C-1]
MIEQTVIRTVISGELKAEFVEAVRANDRIASQVLRDLIREYIYRNSKGISWEPGREKKRLDQSN